MMFRVGPILIVTFDSLQRAVEQYAKRYDMLTLDGHVAKKWEGMYAGLILFCRMVFGVRK